MEWDYGFGDFFHKKGDTIGFGKVQTKGKMQLSFVCIHFLIFIR